MAFERLKSFGSSIKGGITGAPKFIQQIIPGRELARGIGHSLALPYTSKYGKYSSEERERKQAQLEELLWEKLKSGEIDKNRWNKIVNQTGLKSIRETVLEEAPTSKQVVASAVELGLMFSMGYKPGIKGAGYMTRAQTAIYKAGKAAKLAKSLKGATLLKKMGVRLIKPVLKEAAIGSTFWGALEARRKEATTEDIVRAAEKGALISGVFVTAGIGLGEIAKFVGPKIGKAWEQSMIRLEKIAAGKKVKKLATSQINKTLKYIGEHKTIKQRAAGGILKTIQSGRKMKMRFIDRFDPLYRMENRILKIKGVPLLPDEAIYRDARLIPSIADARAERIIVQYSDDLNKFNPKVKTKAKAYLAQLDFIDRAKLGQKVPGGQSLDDLKTGLETMIGEIGPDDMRQVAQIRKITRDLHIGLLDQRVEAGLVSSKLRNTLLKTHPNYLPHNVMMDMDEKAVIALSQSLNVSRTDIMKAVGSAKNINDPFVATVRRTQIATRTIEKNKLLNNLVGAQEKYNVFPGMKKVYQTTKAPSGFDVISLFKNGKKETWMVPADIAVAIKNIDAPLMPRWAEILLTPNKLLKKGATQLNLSFALPNKFRDEQTALLTAGGFMDDLAKRYGVAANPINVSTLSAKEIQHLYKQSGGFGASIFQEGESKIMNNLKKTGVAKNLKYTNPITLISQINESIEMSTRGEVFRRALAGGLDLKNAALASRNASIDFARMGTWMQPLNKAIPFLNARVQGFVNLPIAFVKQPEVFARMQLYTSVYPTMLLHQHNRRFESYANVSQYFKNRYWTIMTGETEAVDSYTGKPMIVPQFVTIPKGEGQQLVGNPIQWWLEKSDKIDYRKVSEMIADTVGSASPMEFQSFDQSNWAGSVISQFGPVATMISGRFSNVHPYFGTPIVPEARKEAPTKMQFKKTTPESTKALANIVGISPAYLEFYLNSFGGLPKDLQNSADIVYNVVREGKIGGHPVTETPFGAATEVPIIGRFLREAKEYYGPKMEERKEKKSEIEKDITGRKLEIKDQAEIMWEEMNKKETRQDKLNYLNSLGDDLTPELKDQLMLFKRYRQAVEVLKPSDSVEVRARYILYRLDEMKEENISRAQQLDFLEDLTDAKVLTKSVKELIWELQHE